MFGGGGGRGMGGRRGMGGGRREAVLRLKIKYETLNRLVGWGLKQR